MKTFFKVMTKIITVFQILAIISMIAAPFISYFIAGNSMCATLLNWILSTPIGIALLILTQCLKKMDYSLLYDDEEI